MPWKECHVMDERLRFVARLLEGEKMAVLCEEFGISGKTGYKIYERYREIGAKGLTDRSRRPHRHANQLPTVVEKAIVRLKKDYPSWGAEDPRAVETEAPGCGVSGHQHGPRGAGPPRAGEPAATPGPSSPDGHDVVAAAGVERARVRGLQGRIPPRQSSLLLSPHDHGLRVPVPPRL